MHAMTTQRKTEEPDSPSDSAPFSAATVHPSKPHGPLDPPDLHSLNFSNSSRNNRRSDPQASAGMGRPHEFRPVSIAVPAAMAGDQSRAFATSLARPRTFGGFLMTWSNILACPMCPFLAA